MKQINIVFDYDYDEQNDELIVLGAVDIIQVPNVVADNLDKIVQEFFNWANEKENGCLKKINNDLICCTDTSKFIEWLNRFYHLEQEDSSMISSHVDYHPELPAVEF